MFVATVGKIQSKDLYVKASLQFFIFLFLGCLIGLSNLGYHVIVVLNKKFMINHCRKFSVEVFSVFQHQAYRQFFFAALQVGECNICRDVLQHEQIFSYLSFLSLLILLVFFLLLISSKSHYFLFDPLNRFSTSSNFLTELSVKVY